MYNRNKYIILLLIIAVAVLLYYTYTNCNIASITNRVSCDSRPKIDSKYNLDNFINPRNNVFFDIQIGNKHIGTIEIELFDDDAPLTSKNFRYLCSNNDLNYNNNYFHRVIPGYFVQGGDIVNNDGTGGFSAYGKYFKDENFNLKHNQEGLLSMANCGKDKNNSQFFISTRRGGCNEFDGKYVVFGIIVKGYNIVKQMEALKIDNNYKLLDKCKISKCGIQNEEPSIVYDTDDVTDNNDDDNNDDDTNDINNNVIKLSI
jgi:peptidylprolyl isomerase